ncbi:MAG: hypothetical protein AABY22_06810 [Nanoarchaeota archaeon]
MNKNFTIEEGDHRSGIYFAPALNNKSEHNIEFMFDSDCYFPLREVDDYDINKLFGFSFGLHHRDSIRLGWRPSKNENKIDIYYYCYNNGVRSFDFICEVDCFRYNTAKIVCDYKSNTFEISITKPYKHTIQLGKIKFIYPKFKIGYYLFPYFGGNKTAPCSMNIFIDRKH